MIRCAKFNVEFRELTVGGVVIIIATKTCGFGSDATLFLLVLNLRGEELVNWAIKNRCVVKCKWR
jgi:hypothetical protein